MARAKSNGNTVVADKTTPKPLRDETTYFYRGWQRTCPTGEPSPLTLASIRAIDRWHEGPNGPAPEGWTIGPNIHRGTATHAAEDELLAALVATHPDALCDRCGEPRKAHATQPGGGLGSDRCEGFDHDKGQERCENCYKPLLIADGPYLDDERCSACSPKAALEAAAPKPVEPANAAGDEHAVASLEERSIVLRDHDDLKMKVLRANAAEENARLLAEASKGPLLTYAGEQWVEAELEACTRAWLEVEDMKALERLKARHGLLTEMRISRASPAAEAAYAARKKEHEDARVELQAFEANHELFLKGGAKPAAADPSPKASEDPSPSARADTSTPSPTPTEIVAALKPTLEPALAKAAADGAADAAKAPPPSVAAQKLAAFVAAPPPPASMPIYPERLLLDLAVAGFSWIGTVEQARKATETAVRDALVGYQGAKRSRRRGEALEALGWARRAADPGPEPVEGESVPF